jgi:hypothetical protein
LTFWLQCFKNEDDNIAQKQKQEEIMSNNNSSGKNLQVNQTSAGAGVSQVFTHPQYEYWKKSWELLRDCALGSIAIKEKGAEYLPKMQGQDNADYQNYLERATYFNMVGRTVNGLVGTIFQRPPKFQDLPPKMKKSVENITKDNKSAQDFSKLIAQEVMTTGRYGVLLDMPLAAHKKPYMTGYVAENILNWKVSEGFDGKEEVTEVVLREFEDRSDPNTPHLNRLVPKYRVLRLGWVEMFEGGEVVDVRWGYQQHVYYSTERTYAGAGKVFDFPNLAGEPDEIITPTNSGDIFEYIPFCFFGPWSNDPDTDKPPLLDIADLTISHYRSYAQLEHGRFYTAMPVFYANVESGSEGGDYYVGPNVVWEITTDKAPGIIEYHGHGLVFLERALDQKEQQISSLGGRMLGVRTNAVAESDNTVALKEKNERSLLLNITTVINNGMSKLLYWYGIWDDIPESAAEKTRIELNQDFLLDTMSAREFRAITLMYQEGVIPIKILHSYFQKAEVIPHDVSEEELLKWLSDPKQFPNQADVHSMQKGFADAKAEQDQGNIEKDRKIAEKEAEANRKMAVEVAEKTTINPAEDKEDGS